MRLDNVEDVYPPAPLQHGMLYHSISAPGSGVFVNQIWATLTGPLDVDAWSAAWRGVVRAHGSLRSIFLWDGLDAPLQVVRGEVEPPWIEEDWSDLSDEERHRRRIELEQADRARGFALDVAPLLRLHLIRISPTSHWQLWSFHHLLLDGWSARLVLREVRAAYRAAHDGQPVPHPSSPPYRDYIAWLESRDASAADEFWRAELEGLREPTRVDALSTTSIARGSGHRQRRHRLETEASDALRNMARAERVTLSTLVQGAWALLMSRYARSSEVIFGVTSTVRPPEIAGIERAIGLYINTLPARVGVEPAARVDEWLRRLQREHARRQEFDYAALDAIQRTSALAPGEALFESIVVFENQPDVDDEPEVEPLSISELEFIEQSNYPLALLVVPADRLELIAVADAARLDDTTVERLLRQLATILAAIARAPRSTLGDVAFDAGGALPPRPQPTALAEARPIHARIAAAAATAPAHTAVVFGDDALSYAELRGRAERLADRLRARGVGPGVPVVILIDRSVEMIVAMLGVLEAGGAYVPLDRDYPEEHLRHVIDETSAPLVLTRTELLAELPDLGVPALAVDDIDSWPDGEVVEAAPAAALDDLAYVIYTSGSTGRPKGVMVEHRSLTASTAARDRVYPEPPDRFLLLSSFAFDSSVAGIYWTLATGGTLVLPRPGEERDLRALDRLIRAHGVSHLLCLPTLYALLAAELGDEPPPSLAVVVVAGEACPPGLVATHHRLLPAVALYNEYGPTEATVWATAHRVEPADARGPVPIGLAIPGTRLAVLDEGRRPVGVGVPGELYIAGAGLARGYWNDPDRTAARFVTLEHPDGGSERAYRTGDLACRREDGRLIYLGRVDTQLKRRGYRVEPEGIEAVLRAQAAVTDAAVAAVEADGGRVRLVAWVAGDGVDPTEVRRQLARRLPEYMLPDELVAVARIPRLPNGKLDRRALPEPAAADSTVAPVAPRDRVESALAEIWRELLGGDAAGVDDTFFALGGDSILAIQVVSRMRQAGYSVTPEQLLANPTIAALAGIVRATDDDAALEDAPCGDVPLTPIQRWFLARDLASPHHWNMAQLFELAEGVDRGRLERAIADCIRHHDMLRARFARRGDVWQQEVVEPDRFSPPVEVIPLTAAVGEARRRELDRHVAAAQAGFELDGGALVRALVFTAEGARPTHLLLAVHHLIFDAVSWTILLDDLERAYRDDGRAGADPLPAKTSSYRAWARELVGRAAHLEPASVAHWSALLADTETELPVDRRAASPPTEADARTHTTVVDKEATAALLTTACEPYASRPEELVITALAIALGRWTGRARALLAREGHGRGASTGSADVSRTIGWFTNQHPIRLELDPASEPRVAIRTIKDQLRRAPDDGSSYGLARYLGPAETARPLAGAPEPQVLFNFLSRTTERRSDLLRPIDGALATARAADNARAHPLEINAQVRAHELEIDWVYSAAVHDHATIERVASQFREALDALLAHCLAPEAGGFTAADFPDAELDGDALDRLLGRID